MFEEQKDKGRKKMGKKEKSILGYKATFQEEINPKLEKLRNEKRSFIQFQKSASELEHTARIGQRIKIGFVKNKRGSRKGRR